MTSFLSFVWWVAKEATLKGLGEALGASGLGETLELSALLLLRHLDALSCPLLPSCHHLTSRTFEISGSKEG